MSGVESVVLMPRRWTRLGLLVALAACLALPSSGVPRGAPTVDSETERQLAIVARTLLQLRSQALVQSASREREEVPDQILGVTLAPQVARRQERALRELENHNRAPVEGGPAFTGVRTELEPTRAVRRGDRITLEAVERTVLRYDTGTISQSVRRLYEFAAKSDGLTLVSERVKDPSANPINDLAH